MDENLEIIVDNGDEGTKANKGKRKRMRNLPQYKTLSDEEFDEKMDAKFLGIEQSRILEERISKKLAEFEEDYDLSDLKINDRDTLRALIQAQITLEDYEQHQFRIRSNGINEATIFATEKIYKIMSDLRADISKLQNDLNITRKIRKSDKDASFISYLQSVKEQAHKFYEAKMAYIFCPKCNMKLATVWSMYPSEERNKIALVCGRVMSDGTTCGEKVIVGTKELFKNRGTNKKEITPESFL